LLPQTITRPVARLGAAAQNALEVARFGGLDTEQKPSPYEVISEQRVYRLRHYYDGRDGAAPGLVPGSKRQHLPAAHRRRPQAPGARGRLTGAVS
jgi:hypothetical protein